MNKRNYWLSRAVIIFVLGLFGPSNVQAATITVGPSGTDTAYNYNSIQAAVDAATGQDVISIEAGEYTEQVRVPANSELSISGDRDNPETVVLNGNIQFQESTVIPLIGASVSGLTIHATGLQYAIQTSQWISLFDMDIKGGYDGIVIKAGGDLDITDSTIRRATRYGILLKKEKSSLWMYTSVVKKNGAAGIRINGDFYGRFQDSEFAGNGRGITLHNANLLNETGEGFGLQSSHLHGNKIGLLLINSTLDRANNTFKDNDKNILIQSQYLEIIADKLSSCTAYKTTFKHPFTGDMLEKEILGIVNGKCDYVEQMPNGGKMECQYTASERKAVAQYYKDVASVESVGTSVNVNLGSGEQKTTYTINGKVVNDPLQEVINSGVCVISGY